MLQLGQAADGRGHAGGRAPRAPRGRRLHETPHEAGQGAQVGRHVPARREHAEVRETEWHLLYTMGRTLSRDVLLCFLSEARVTKWVVQ